MTPEGRRIKRDYQLEARSQWRLPALQGELELDITLYFGTKRRSDVDNFHKLSLDALTGILYADDSQITDFHVHKRYDKERPRIEISVVQ